jgi:hypothetical protein
MLSFELKNGQGDELEVQCDSTGLQSLLAQLQLLIEGQTEHVHLMAESWGGSHLDEHPHTAANRAIRHVKITLWRSV